MSFVPAICPQCAGALQVPEDRDIIKCMYCGVDVVVRQAIRLVTTNSGNALKLAENAALAGNHDEALKYYNRVLENEPNNAKAWLGKGLAAGWLSTLSNFRLGEVVVGARNAVEMAAPEDQKLMRTAAGMGISQLASTLFTSSTQHMRQFISLDQSFDTYLLQCQQIIELLEFGVQLDPSASELKEMIVVICTGNIQGESYQDNLDPNAVFSKRRDVTPQYRVILQEMINRYAAEIRAVSPEYVPPTPAKASMCFVVTAAHGDEYHPNVLMLRRYRDETLVTTSVGRGFISVYNVIGPVLAAGIAHSTVLRALTRALIVRPAVTAVELWRRSKQLP